MNRPISAIQGISRQRGSWLRCFLDRALIPAAILTVAIQLVNAQIEVQKPLHVSTVHGYVVDMAGKPVEGVQVELLRGDVIQVAAKTNGAGEFGFASAKGKFWLRTRYPDAAIGAREVIVGTGSLGLSHDGPIYVMLRPGGACSDCSSQVFATKKELDRALREIAESKE